MSSTECDNLAMTDVLGVNTQELVVAGIGTVFVGHGAELLHDRAQFLRRGQSGSWCFAGLQ